MPPRNALLSLHDKDGLAGFARGLHRHGVTIYATGGTGRELEKAGVPFTPVSVLAGKGGLLGGRVKTLHPALHAGILALRESPEQMAELASMAIPPLDIVAVNLYPFEEALRRNAPPEEMLENIDIGGHALIRAAAKNHASVAVAVSAEHCAAILRDLDGKGDIAPGTRLRLATEALEYAAAYDAAVAGYFRSLNPARFPGTLTVSARKVTDLRYGENPYQSAAFYALPGAPTPSVSSCTLLHGKPLSYNNILDFNDALLQVGEFDRPAAVVVKHTNPCGAAVADALPDAFRRAHECDPKSAYGSVVGLNREVDAATARIAMGFFVEGIVAPSFSPDALALLKGKKNLRLLAAGEVRRTGNDGGMEFRSVLGGLLVQEAANPALDPASLKCVTARRPTEAETGDLLFAWSVARFVKSNAIVLVKGGATVGIGAGQMSRVDAVEIAVRKSGGRSRGSVLASDAFFPFRDGVDAAAAGGVAAIVQPGGSIRDAEVIRAADDNGIAMLFTGVRAFRH